MLGFRTFKGFGRDELIFRKVRKVWDSGFRVRV